MFKGIYIFTVISALGFMSAPSGNMPEASASSPKNAVAAEEMTRSYAFSHVLRLYDKRM